MPAAETDTQQAVFPWQGDECLPEKVHPFPYGFVDDGQPVGVADEESLVAGCREAVGRGMVIWVWTPASAHLVPASSLPQLRDVMVEQIATLTAHQSRKQRDQLILYLALVACGLVGAGMAMPVMVFLLVIFGLLPALDAMARRRRLRQQPEQAVADFDAELRWQWWSGAQSVVQTKRLAFGLIAVFIATWMSTGHSALPVLTWTGDLQFLGAYMVDADAIRRGEWWRLLTGTLLHGGLVHAGFNIAFLWTIGGQLERLLGWPLLVTVAFASGLGGALASFGFGSGASVGFSGALCGLLGLQLAMIQKYRGLPGFLHRQTWTTLILLIAIGFLGSGTIDNAGHAGGLVVGFMLGDLILRNRPQIPVQVPQWGLRTAWAALVVYGLAMAWLVLAGLRA